MAFTSAEQQRLLAALATKIPAMPPCELCRSVQWNVSDKWSTLPLQETAGVFNIGGASLPVIAIICISCGNTKLLNLIILGLGDMLQPTAPAGVADAG